MAPGWRYVFRALSIAARGAFSGALPASTSGGCYRSVYDPPVMSDHLSILRKGVKAWNSYRRAALDSDPDPDLTAADLRGADLRGANLQGGRFSGANLRGSDLRGTDLRDADLTGADLTGADLRGADLRGADLQGANLQGANLQGVEGVSVSVPLTAEEKADVEGLEELLHQLEDREPGEADVVEEIRRLIENRDLIEKNRDRNG